MLIYIILITEIISTYLLLFSDNTLIPFKRVYICQKINSDINFLDFHIFVVTNRSIPIVDIFLRSPAREDDYATRDTPSLITKSPESSIT